MIAPMREGQGSVKMMLRKSLVASCSGGSQALISTTERDTGDEEFFARELDDEPFPCRERDFGLRVE
jgi:hypothetical protein